MRTTSLLRREEYKALSNLTLQGKVLDVGGSKRSGYHELIRGEHSFIVANLEESYGTDMVFDAQETWPFEDASFDAVLFINVLEHLYRYEQALDECARVLKEGGKVVGVVPFMFNVHGSPNDHFRYTRSTLELLLAERGFDPIRIQELGTGAFSVIYHCLLGFVRWDWLASLLIPVFSGLDRLVHALKPDSAMSAREMPLGYYFEAIRASTEA